MVGLIPDRTKAVIDGRKTLCEALAVDYSLAAGNGDLHTIRQGLDAIVKRDPDVLSVGLRLADGTMLIEIGDHRADWSQRTEHKSTATHMLVPISVGNAPWGTLEVTFREAGGPALGPFPLYDVGLVLFVAVAGAILFYFYLGRILDRLNPSKVVPNRVRNTLNTLAEGLLVLDNSERILLANDNFAKTIGIPTHGIVGRHISELSWTRADADGDAQEYPWTKTIRTQTLQAGATVTMESPTEGTRIFRVNASPIVAEDETCRGVLASFEDITLLEQRTAKLSDALHRLKTSRDQIRRQNEQLTALATRDPLTMCLNRRAFHEQFEHQLAACHKSKTPLSCLLLDIDHFKHFNDNHGHATGDEVLKMVAGVMRDVVGQNGAVGRYGGEEFCVFLPGRGIEEAAVDAEEIRRRIESTGCTGLRVTASLGVSNTGSGSGSSDQRKLFEEADKALYAAKNKGRNQVVLWDQIRDQQLLSTVPRFGSEQPHEGDQVPIPCHAVSVLVSVLQHRHPPIAEHCQRVADQCVTVAEGLLSGWDRYVLEVAALLHDIGKLSVPDSILLKDGPLTEPERTRMRTCERVGVEILSTTFASPELNAVVRCRNAWFNGTPHDPSLPTGEDIPLGSRLLFIAEAYDAIVTNQVFRKGVSHAEAVVELRRGAGTQFDPNLVERFIDIVSVRAKRSCLAQGNTSHKVALRIGHEIEKLACTLDTKDRQSLVDFTQRLEATAVDADLTEIADVASLLKDHALLEPNWDEIIHLGANLTDICCVQQSTLLPEQTID